MDEIRIAVERLAEAEEQKRLAVEEWQERRDALLYLLVEEPGESCELPELGVRAVVVRSHTTVWHYPEEIDQMERDLEEFKAGAQIQGTARKDRVPRKAYAKLQPIK